MNYNRAEMTSGNFGATVRIKTETEIKEFVEGALAIVDAQRAPIVPPENLSEEDKAIYMAVHNVFRRPIRVDTDSLRPQQRNGRTLNTKFQPQ